jgi:hypothetical protein
MQYKSENCMYADWLSDGVSLELAGTTPVARLLYLGYIGDGEAPAVVAVSPVQGVGGAHHPATGWAGGRRGGELRCSFGGGGRIQFIPTSAVLEYVLVSPFLAALVLSLFL